MRIHTLALAIVAATSLAACQKQPSPETATPAPQPTATTAPAPGITPPPATSVPGPVAGTRLTEPYVRMAARDAYFWAWPMVNIYNRRLGFKDLPGPG
ncbi:MAG TPA: hypothetical protein VGD42_07615, partial [Lysobacter sp.]